MMRRRRSHLVAVGLCAGLLLASALPARAQEQGGRFAWRPSLRILSLVDDNVLLEDGNRNGDVGFWLIPRVELDYRAPAVELGADLGVDFRRYIEGDSRIDAELYRAIGWAEVGLGPGLSLRMSDAFVPQPVRLGRPSDEAINLMQTNRAEIDLRWWRELGQGREFKVGAMASHFLTEDYAESLPAAGGGLVVDPDFRADYIQGLAFAELQSPLGERSAGYVRAQFSYRDFTDYSPADHTNLSLLLGFESNRWKDLSVELAGGAGAIGFGSFADALRALARLGLRYRLPLGLTVSLAGSYLVSPNLARDDAMQSNGEIGLEQRFGPATAASARVFVTYFDGYLHGVSNLFGGAEVRLRRQLTRNIQVGVRYLHYRNAGDLGLDDFAKNRITLELGFSR